MPGTIIIQFACNQVFFLFMCNYDQIIFSTIRLSEFAVEDEIGALFANIRTKIKNSSHEDGENTSSIVLALRELATCIPGFDYRIAVDSRHVINCIVIQTSRQRARLREYGRIVFLDATEQTNKENYSAFFPTIYSEQNKLQRVGTRSLFPWYL